MRMRPILLTLLLAAAMPALAQQAPSADPAPPAAEPVAPADAARPAEARTDRHCLRETGTHIRARAGERRCSAFAGRVWTREDLDRTGHVDIAQALRTLDVSIR